MSSLKAIANLITKILITKLTIFSTVYASNYHEHFEALPLASHFVDSTYRDILNLPHESQTLDHFFRNHSDLVMLIAYAAQKPVESVKENLSEDQFHTLTLKELFALWDQQSLSGQSLFKNMLRISEDRPLGYKTDRLLYKIISNFRRKLLLALPVSTVTNLFTTYFSHDALENRDTIYLTTPSEFFSPEQISKLFAMKKVAQQHNSKVQFFKSIIRIRLVQNDDIDRIADIERLISAEILSGIDITGSIDEDDLSSDRRANQLNYEAKYLESLNKIARVASKHNIPLRIHSFEGVNSGVFYQALEAFIRNYDQKLFLQIGHINHIDKKWLEIIKSNPNLLVSVNVNLVSVLTMQNQTTVERILEKVELVKSYGFTILFGSDGRGVLPKSSYKHQMEILAAFGSIKKPCIVFLRKGGKSPPNSREQLRALPNWLKTIMSH